MAKSGLSLSVIHDKLSFLPNLVFLGGEPVLQMGDLAGKSILGVVVLDQVKFFRLVLALLNLAAQAVIKLALPSDLQI